MSLGFDIDAEIVQTAQAIREASFVQEHNFRTRGVKAGNLAALTRWMEMLQRWKSAGGGTAGMTSLAQKVPLR